MTRLAVLSATAFFLALFAACSGSSNAPSAVNPTSDSGAGDGGNAMPDAGLPPLQPQPGALGLRADAVRQARSATAADDLEVSFTLANGMGGKPAPLVDALFQVKTSDGILHTGTQYESFWWVDGTVPDGMSSLAGGYSVELSVSGSPPAPRRPSSSNTPSPA